MTLQDFYDILDKELETVIADNPRDENLHKGDVNTRKAYALLVWFMRFYAKEINYKLDITQEYTKNSCTIIFSTINAIGKEIIYIVHGNWESFDRYLNPNDPTDFKVTLDYFKLVNSHKKEFTNKNEYFNEYYKLVKRYSAANKPIQFIYLSLEQITPLISEYIAHFNKQTADIEFIDIERLKRDFIEVRFNKSQPQNLENVK